LYSAGDRNPQRCHRITGEAKIVPRISARFMMIRSGSAGCVYISLPDDTYGIIGAASRRRITSSRVKRT
jgi:hypothetical protein